MTILANIPEELKQLNQWVCTDHTKIPFNPRTLQKASVTAPDTWGSFEEAVASGAPYIGFVFTKDDPYTFIDLDTVKKPDYAALHYDIISKANGFAEISISGHSYHIIVKGALPAGLRDDVRGIEIYPHGRFAVMTGNVIPPSITPIGENQPLLDFLSSKISTAKPTVAHLTSQPTETVDADLIANMTRAVNGDKFAALFSGNWEQLPEYNGDHSRADLGLLTILDYYSKDVEQVVRLFKQSGLYRPNKGRSNSDGTDYIMRSLQKARSLNQSEIPQEVVIDGLKKATQVLLARHKAKTPTTAEVDLPAPPGLVGEVASYIYTSSIRPMKEVALLGAITLLAGVAGRQYNVSGTGLNQYLILLAPTGSGKEGAASGIGRLLAEVQKRVPAVNEFRGASQVASGQALLKAFIKQPCQFSILGEFGLKLQQMADARASPADKKLQEVLLDLYNKSGQGDELGETIYSDREKNVTRISSPSLTMLGESTPEMFFSKLNESHVCSGLLPRFLFMEYTGKRPEKNKTQAFVPPSEGLINHIIRLTETVIRLQRDNRVIQIEINPDAKELLDAFDTKCDGVVDGATELQRNLWSRADLMVLRLSGLLAVGLDPSHPVITTPLVQWAITFVTSSVTVISAKFENGQVGDTEAAHEGHLIRTVNRYWKIPNEVKIKTYKIPKTLLDQPIIPYTFLRRTLKMLSVFQNDRRGTVTAIKMVLQDACEAQLLIKIPKATAMEKFGVTADVYTLGQDFPDQ